jgi:hypothetical protein
MWSEALAGGVAASVAAGARGRDGANAGAALACGHGAAGIGPVADRVVSSVWGKGAAACGPDSMMAAALCRGDRVVGVAVSAGALEASGIVSVVWGHGAAAFAAASPAPRGRAGRDAGVAAGTIAGRVAVVRAAGGVGGAKLAAGLAAAGEAALAGRGVVAPVVTGRADAAKWAGSARLAETVGAASGTVGVAGRTAAAAVTENVACAKEGPWDAARGVVTDGATWLRAVGPTGAAPASAVSTSAKLPALRLVAARTASSDAVAVGPEDGAVRTGMRTLRWKRPPGCKTGATLPTARHPAGPPAAAAEIAGHNLP